MTSTLRRRALAVAAALAITMTAGCGGEESASGGGSEGAEEESQDSQESAEQKFPDIVEVDVTREDNRTASFAVTVSSPYDSPDRYADGWRVMDQDGEVLGEHMLGHDHAGEQPFTRTQDGVAIPEGTTSLTIEGRDQQSGYGGETVSVEW